MLGGISWPSLCQVCTSRDTFSPSLNVSSPPAGLFSGLVSHIVSARIRFPQLVLKLVSNPSAAAGSASSIAGGSLKSAAQLSAKDASSSILPSLGASGAIYAAVTLTAMAFPETEISLIFPPTFPIPIQWGVGGMVALDVMGVLRGWRLVFSLFHPGSDDDILNLGI